MTKTTTSKEKELRNKVLHFVKKTKDDGYPKHPEKPSLWTYKKLHDKTGYSEPYLRSVVGDILISSVNQRRRYVIWKGHFENLADRYGFIDVDGIIFHEKDDTKSVLRHLAKKKDAGILPEEAEKHLGRDCYRPLKELAEEELLVRKKVHGKLVYLHPSREDIQKKNRICNKRLKPKVSEETSSDEIIPIEDVTKTLADLQLPDSLGNDDETLSALCIGLVKKFKAADYRELQTMIKLDSRVQGACLIEDGEIPSYSTLCRYINDLDTKGLLDLFSKLVEMLYDEDIVDGDYLVVDSTHIFAWANTRKNIENGEVEQAYWSYHEDTFYGYKLHLVVDAQAELPLALFLTPGNEADSTMYVPLVQKVKTYDFEEIKAVYADAGYDSKDLREATIEELSASLYTVLNPRRDEVKKSIKEEIKEAFKEHGEDIECVKDVLERIPQKLLTAFGMDPGSDKESSILGAIRERLNRPFRSSVERVIGRLKNVMNIENPKTQDFENIWRNMLISFIGMNLTALTAKEIGMEEKKLSLSSVY